MRLVAASVVAIFLCARPTLAASLRHDVSLRTDKVHLTDLFSGLPQGLDPVLGDAPAPGKSYDVGGTQLTAIAAQYAVDWPEASPLLSVTLTRSAHVYGHDFALTLLRSALHIAPTDTETDVSLDSFEPLVVPIEVEMRPVLQRFSYAADTGGNFSAMLVIDLPVPVQVRLTGVVSRQTDAIAVIRPVGQGEPVLPDNITITRVRSDKIPADGLILADEAIGLTARTPLVPGHPIGASQLSHPTLIAKNSSVIMNFDTPALHVTASGIALDSGGRNDIVRVLNPSTQMVVTGRVGGRAQVDILPGATPVPADARLLGNGLPATLRRT